MEQSERFLASIQTIRIGRLTTTIWNWLLARSAQAPQLLEQWNKWKWCKQNAACVCNVEIRFNKYTYHGKVNIPSPFRCGGNVIGINYGWKESLFATHSESIEMRMNGAQRNPWIFVCVCRVADVARTLNTRHIAFACIHKWEFLWMNFVSCARVLCRFYQWKCYIMRRYPPLPLACSLYALCVYIVLRNLWAAFSSWDPSGKTTPLSRQYVRK